MFSAWRSSAKSKYDCCQLELLWGSVVCGGCSSIFIQQVDDSILSVCNRTQQLTCISITSSINNYSWLTQFSVMLSPRGQTVLEAKILSLASTSCPWPRPQASGLGMSSDFVTWPRAYVYFTTKPKPMICIRQYVPCHPSTNLLFTAIWLASMTIGRMFAEMIRL